MFAFFLRSVMNVLSDLWKERLRMILNAKLMKWMYYFLILALLNISDFR